MLRLYFKFASSVWNTFSKKDRGGSEEGYGDEFRVKGARIRVDNKDIGVHKHGGEKGDGNDLII